jgi:glycerol-3-phosphate dehydrogenase (NAD+)
MLAQKKEKVAIIGSGNWGSAIAKVVGRNLLNLDGYEKEVRVPQCDGNPVHRLL